MYGPLCEGPELKAYGCENDTWQDEAKWFVFSGYCVEMSLLFKGPIGNNVL